MSSLVARHSTVSERADSFSLLVLEHFQVYLLPLSQTVNYKITLAVSSFPTQKITLLSLT